MYGFSEEAAMNNYSDVGVGISFLEQYYRQCKGDKRCIAEVLSKKPHPEQLECIVWNLDIPSPYKRQFAIYMKHVGDALRQAYRRYYEESAMSFLRYFSQSLHRYYDKKWKLIEDVEGNVLIGEYINGAFLPHHDAKYYPDDVIINCIGGCTKILEVRSDFNHFVANEWKDGESHTKYKVLYCPE